MPRVGKIVALLRTGQFVIVRRSWSVAGERAIPEFLWLVAASFEFLISSF